MMALSISFVGDYHIFGFFIRNANLKFNWNFIKSEFDSTKDTPYLALTIELWGAFNEDFWENWSHYNSTTL